MMTLNDGRSELWQWDTNRKLTVDADCSQVHFSNKVFGRSIDVDVTDGVAIIPDVLLQTDKDLNAWAFVGTAENGYTKISKTFKVNRRNKPADYVFTPVEQTTIAEIAAIAQSVRDDADAGLFDGKPGEDGRDGVDGKDGSDANVTAENIEGALGYTPANEESVNQLKQDKLDKPVTPPDSAGKVLRVLSVNEDGTFTCEWADDAEGVTDVQVNGTSIVSNGVANVPLANSTTLGCVKPIEQYGSYGININSQGEIYVVPATINDINLRNNAYRSIPPSRIDYAVKAAMCDGKGPAWTAEEQAAARDRIGIDKPFELIEEIVCDGEATAYTRTVDVNGNPYNLLSVYIEFEIETGNSYTSSVFFRAYDAESNTVLYEGSSVSQKNYVSYVLGGVDAKNGMYQGWMISGNIASYNSGGSNTKRINRRAPIISPIKKIYIMIGGGLKFLSGDKIRIYGVRA